MLKAEIEQVRTIAEKIARKLIKEELADLLAKKKERKAKKKEVKPIEDKVKTGNEPDNEENKDQVLKHIWKGKGVK